MHVGNQMVSGNTFQTNMAATQTVIVKVKYISSKIACAQTAPPLKTKSERNDLKERILSDFVLRGGAVCAQAIQRMLLFILKTAKLKSPWTEQHKNYLKKICGMTGSYEQVSLY